MQLSSSLSSSGMNSAIDTLTDPNRLTTDGSGRSLEALQSAGRDFESVLFSLLLKEMRTASDNSGEGGLFAGDKTDTLGGMFDLYLSQHLASSSSLGIAKTIESYLANQSSKSDFQDAESSGQES